MEQNKLFYNVCNDLWAFAKTLDKPKEGMDDADWQKAVDLMDQTAEKYKSLGYDTFGPLKLMGGIQKGHSDEKVFPKVSSIELFCAWCYI